MTKEEKIIQELEKQNNFLRETIADLITKKVLGNKEAFELAYNCKLERTQLSNLKEKVSELKQKIEELTADNKEKAVTINRLQSKERAEAKRERDRVYAQRKRDEAKAPASVMDLASKRSFS